MTGDMGHLRQGHLGTRALPSVSLDQAQEPLTLASAEGLGRPTSPFVTIDIKTTQTKPGAGGSPGFWFSVDQNVHKETGKH